MSFPEQNAINPYEFLSQTERQREFEKMLDSIPRFYRGDPPMMHNLGFINKLRELLVPYSRGTKNCTRYILKKSANSTLNVTTTPIKPEEFDPAYIASFPETLYDEGEGLFGQLPSDIESKVLTGYEMFRDVEDVAFIHRWKQEFKEHYGVDYHSPFL